jgi:WXXGXW repeat (2 copies)
MPKRALNALLLSAALGAAAWTGAAGCAVAPPPPPDAVFVDATPPTAVVEVRGELPGPDYIWINGYHRWDGRAYVWVGGRWERRPRAGAVWVDGRWHRHNRGWYWIEGRWR